MRSFSILIAVLVVVPVLAGPTNQEFLGELVQPVGAAIAEGPIVSLKMSSPAASNSPLVAAWNRSLAELALTTMGRLSVHPFHSGTIHGTGFGFKALRTGNSDLATCYSATKPHAFHLASVWSLPFIAPQRSVIATYIAMALQEKYFAPEYERQGVTLAAQYVLPPTNLLTRTPIHRLEDLRGLRIAATPTQAATLRALHAEPVLIPFPEYYVALQRGMVDGILWIDIAMLAYRVTEVAKYRTVVGLSGSSADLCFSNSFRDSVPGSTFTALHRFSRGMQLYAAMLTDHEWGDNLERRFASQGVSTVVISGSEHERWRQATRPVVDEWVTKAGEERQLARNLLSDIHDWRDRFEATPTDEIAASVLKNLSLSDTLNEE